MGRTTRASGELRRLSRSPFDFVEAALGQQLGLGEPAAAAAEHVLEGEILEHVLGVNATGGHEGYVGVDRRERLQRADAAELLGRKELQHVDPEIERLLD